MRPIVLIITIIFALVLKGCGSVVLPTVAALTMISPLEADPADFEIAADLPLGADVQVNGATFTITMMREDTGETIMRDFILQRRQTADGRILFRVHPDDLNAFRALQKNAKLWEAESAAAASGSVGMSVTACRTSEVLDKSATFSVFIRTVQDGPFLPLLRDISVSDALDQIDAPDDVATSSTCE